MKVDRAEKVIAMLYVAIQREGWEKGPTIEEAIDSANDFYYFKHGEDADACASDYYPKILGLKAKP